MEPDTALALCRFGHDAAATILWGAFAFVWTLVPAGLAADIGRRLTTLRVAAIVVAGLTTAAALPLEAASIGEGWTDATTGSTILAVLLDTSVGWAWIVQALAALLLAATLLAPARRQAGATAAASGLLLATLALTGHAAMHEGALGLLHRLNDAVHVLAGGAWLGALVPLLPLLRALGDPQRRREAGIALRRFSAAGHAAVALVIATGIANMALVLGRWPTDWSSPYQALLAAKIALVAIMTVLALGNRYVVVPRMSRSCGQSLRTLRAATIAEIGLGVAALACVSLFGLLEPV